MIVTQEFGWSQIARRRGLGWPQGTKWAMQQAAQAGLAGWEPFLETPQDADRVAHLAAQCGLKVPSFFVAGALHTEPGPALERMSEIAARAASFGSTIAAVYPEPLQNADKSDRQLAIQFDSLNVLAQCFARLGVRLLYHPEEPEMRHAAREFHHMLARSDPAKIGLCLDPDTIWRGAGRSNLAVLDVVHLYGDRVEAIHLRQSSGGVWAETFGPGEIDYARISAALQRVGATPLLVLETAHEDDAPDLADPIAAERNSLDYATSVFSYLLNHA